jgi:hypothetical protein
LNEFIYTLEAHDEERAIQALRAYYERVDADLMQIISGGLRPG